MIYPNASLEYPKGFLSTKHIQEDMSTLVFDAWLEEHGHEYLMPIPPPRRRGDKPLLTGPDSFKYFITLTTQTDDPKPLAVTVQKILSSKRIKPSKWVYSWELTKDGYPHVHMLLHTSHYIAARDILSFNRNERIDLQKVKSINSVRNYILKIKSVDEIEYFEFHDLPDLVVWSSENDSDLPEEL